MLLSLGSETLPDTILLYGTALVYASNIEHMQDITGCAPVGYQCAGGRECIASMRHAARVVGEFQQDTLRVATRAHNSCGQSSPVKFELSKKDRVLALEVFERKLDQESPNDQHDSKLRL